MKKILEVLLVVCLNVNLIGANAENFSVANAIENLKLTNDLIAYEAVMEANEQDIQKQIQKELDRKDPYRNMTKAEYIELIKQQSVLTPEKVFYFYDLGTTKYTKQYVENGSFEYLINPTKIWCLSYNNHASGCAFSEDDYNQIKLYNRLMDNDGLEFLLNSGAIEKMVSEEIDESVTDCKVIHVPLTTFLYLKGEQTDYAIKLAESPTYDEDTVHLEKFKIYKLTDLLQSIGMYETLPLEGVFEEKPVYETEAQSLQADGLLKGNENGLDLLKPLTRIEATAMLVRAMGLEDSETSDTSYFADIQSENWGAKYANIARDKGIANGVGNGCFAPNEKITASQFATLILRNAGENPDWQTAVNTFVERGLLSQEQADKMDLFTRGDMAKMIYEAVKNGIM